MLMIEQIVQTVEARGECQRAHAENTVLLLLGVTRWSLPTLLVPQFDRS